jgi:glycosyltransferase involved in cell wall biosynthesis
MWMSAMLSICIPTHNRSEFLRWTLDKLLNDFPQSEIIISDNNSSDATRFMWHESAKYIRQTKNIGAFPNMRAALLEATGEYAVFCADDDYLIPGEVKAGIEFLDAHPGVVAYFAPCQLYDEMAGGVDPYGNAFYVGTDETFFDASKLWNFVIHNHVWPEHAIYRRTALEKILQPRTNAYWCFVDLANAAAAGAVHFASKPYYRNITNHPVGARVKLGDQQCLTDFDVYRAGLETLAFDLFRDRLNMQLKVTINRMINHFINLRLGVAHRIFTMQGRAEEANTIVKRLMICVMDNDAPPGQIRMSLPKSVAA